MSAKMAMKDNLGFGDEAECVVKAQQAKIRPAVEALIAEAEQAAQGQGEYYSYEEVFGEEEDE